MSCGTGAGKRGNYCFFFVIVIRKWILKKKCFLNFLKWVFEVYILPGRVLLFEGGSGIMNNA